MVRIRPQAEQQLADGLPKRAAWVVHKYYPEPDKLKVWDVVVPDGVGHSGNGGVTTWETARGWS